MLMMIITYIILKGVTFLEFVWNWERLHRWTPIEISRSRILRAADSDTSDDDVSLDDCLSLNYQPVHGVQCLDLRLKLHAGDAFWLQIAYRTRARVRLKSTDTWC